MSAVERPGSPRPDDDMHDRKEEDRNAPFPLGPFLRLCDPYAGKEGPEPCLRSDFEDADGRARREQRIHHRLVQCSVLSGFVAIFAGLAQNLFKWCWLRPPDGIGFRIEFVFTITALVLVLWALFSRKQETWLLERFKAERLRLVKFRLLIEPKLWQPGSTDIEPVRARVESERTRILHMPEDLLDALKNEDALPDLPRTDDCARVEPAALSRLLDYYRRKRIGFQLRYFEERMRQKAPRTENRMLQPLFFFLGIALSLANLLIEWATNGDPVGHLEAATRWLVFFALILPFGWSAIRTLRGSREFARNRARSHARHASLSELRRGLEAATGGPAESWDRVMIFGYLFLCEGLLAADQHEWIRLMREAEVYG